MRVRFLKQFVYFVRVHKFVDVLIEHILIFLNFSIGLRADVQYYCLDIFLGEQLNCLDKFLVVTSVPV